MRSTRLTKYYHSIPDDFVPKGVLHNKRLPNAEPQHRIKTMQALALSPHITDRPQHALLTLGSSILYSYLVNHRVALKDGISELLSLPRRNVSLSIIRNMEKKRSQGPLLNNVHPVPSPSNTEILATNNIGRSVIVRSKFEVQVSSSYSLEERVAFAAELWNLAEDSPSIDLFRHYGINFVAFPEPNFDVDFTRFGGMEISEAHAEMLKDREEVKMMNADLYLESL
ncbi:hypothetical protein XU18_0057 [Perkinsela sp. CCAP 1560/4]|nr:hypothetical protein XU18_0057 [Perkinsela sp. CCAP 1560/4]|eukprot:KNH09372.1 hypothetical protein XU18_0057 [Perkinsela sp. CCAP 1560/4]